MPFAHIIVVTTTASSRRWHSILREQNVRHLAGTKPFLVTDFIKTSTFIIEDVSFFSRGTGAALLLLKSLLLLHKQH